MPRVRVRLHTKRARLEFRGDEALFGRTIESLILRAAGRGSTRRTAAETAKPTPAVARGPVTSGPGSAGGTVPPGYAPPSQDFGTFCRRLAPGENGAANRIAAFAFFLWNYERKEVFQEEEVLGCFRAEGAEPPTNGASIYDDLVSRRILTPAEARGTWTLTSKGRAHVRHHLLSA